MIDVDEFKSYNDHFGHGKGDQCLQRVAALLQETERRRTNLVARYGGEEFVILLCTPQPGEAERLAEQIHRGLSALQIPHPASRVAPQLTVSIGFSYLVPSSDKGWQTLTEQADQALYHAKSQGRAVPLPICRADPMSKALPLGDEINAVASVYRHLAHGDAPRLWLE